jgi:hypothetical protein
VLPLLGLSAIPWLLFLIWAEFDPLGHPYTFFIPAGCVAGFWYWLAVTLGVPNMEMRRVARQERKLPPEVNIQCIKHDDWPLFLSKLQEPGLSDHLQALLERQKQISGKLEQLLHEPHDRKPDA